MGGFLSSMVGIAAVAVYIVGTWSGPHRALGLMLIAGPPLAMAVLILLPARITFGTRRRELVVAASWSLCTVALVIAGEVLDGGLHSPIALLSFVPVVFASLAYRSSFLVALIGVVTLAATVAIGVLDDNTSWSYTYLFGVALVLVTAICTWQARLERQSRRQLAIASRTDWLTDCLNRRGFYERFDAAVADAERRGEPLALVEFDIDDFKFVNDLDGHDAGDRLLVHLVGQVREQLRGGDALGRLGGDEFVVLAPGTDLPGAVTLAERIERDVAPTTVSIGIAIFPDHGRTLDDLYHVADKRMYATKRMRRLEEDRPVAHAGP